MNVLIPVAPVTKKNSQRIIMAGGRPMIIPSAAYKDYEKAALAAMVSDTEEPFRISFSEPVNVACRYYMPTKRRVDLVNLLEATDDVLVKAGLLRDDNSDIVASHDGSRVYYDREFPRTEISITLAQEAE